MKMIMCRGDGCNASTRNNFPSGVFRRQWLRSCFSCLGAASSLLPFRLLRGTDHRRGVTAIRSNFLFMQSFYLLLCNCRRKRSGHVVSLSREKRSRFTGLGLFALTNLRWQLTADHNERPGRVSMMTNLRP